MKNADGLEVGAIRGVIGSILRMLEDNVTHVGVATDHTVKSFRNDLYDGYKTGAGIDPDLLQQFHPLEEALRSLGIVVWPMVEHEADDGLASASMSSSEDKRVEQVFICTPDKDLAQCVRGRRIVQFDRRAGIIRDAEGVRKRFGVKPESIVDYLALVGDPADGYPGLPGWGAKSTSTLLERYLHFENIPLNSTKWDVKVRSAPKLASSLAKGLSNAVLFRDLATLRTEPRILDSVDELEWKGPTPSFFDTCAMLNAPGYFKRATALTRPS